MAITPPSLPLGIRARLRVIIWQLGVVACVGLFGIGLWFVSRGNMGLGCAAGVLSAAGGIGMVSARRSETKRAVERIVRAIGTVIEQWGP